MSKTVADAIIDVFAKAGARRCYGVPGDTLNYVTDAIRRSDIRFVHVRHEEAGAMAAGADALLTDELTLCAGSCGPGSLHFINGVWEATRNRAPVVLIASQIVRDEQGFDFPQEVDYHSVYAKGTVFCEEVLTASQARRKAAMAAQAAYARKGVAVLIVPADVSAEKAPDEPDFEVHRASPVVRPNDAELARIAAILNEGGKVAIYGGSGCRGAHDAVVALGQKLKAPIAHTSRAKDFLGHDNPCDVGLTGVFGTRGGYDALIECDTLLLLGCDFAWRQFYPSKARIVQVDIDGSHLGRRHPIEVGVVGDVRATVDALLPLVGEKADRAFLDASVKGYADAMAALDERAEPGERGIVHPQYLVDTIARHAAPDAVWTADGGSPMVWCLRHVPTTGRNRTVVSLSHGTMAAAMPQAMGAKAAYPDRQVISLSGDGGLSMLMGDLITTVQEQLPIKIVVFNNGSLGFVELEQKVEGLLNAFTGLKNPDFSKVAEAIGLLGWRVEHPDALDAAVAAWLAAPGPALLDVVVERDELVMPPKVEAKQVLGMALYSAKGLMSGEERAKDVVGLIKDALLK